MSDYRSSHENNNILYKSVDDENNFSSGKLNNRLSIFEREAGISSQDNVYNSFERSRKYHQQTDMFRSSSPQNDSGNNTDVSYIEEVERISLSLIKLLRAREKRVRKSAHADRMFFLTDTASETVGATGGRSCSISLGTRRDDLETEKVRQGEDTYDKIEDKAFSRRAELGGQHPEYIDMSKNQEKYSILNEFGDVIKKVRKCQDHVRQLEGKLRERDTQIKKLALRLEQLKLLNTGKPTNIRGTDAFQNKTPLKKPYFDLTIQDLRSDTLKTPSQTVTRGVAMDDLSTTASDDSTSSS